MLLSPTSRIAALLTLAQFGRAALNGTSPLLGNVEFPSADVPSRHSNLRAKCDLPILSLQHIIRQHWVNGLDTLNE